MSRVLITGLSTYWGGRLAQALERDPDVEVIVGDGSLLAATEAGLAVPLS